MLRRITGSSTPQEQTESPYTQLAFDKSKILFKVLLFAAGPIFKDAPHVIRNFRDCHNVIRNAIYTFIVVVCTGLFIYIAATFTNFKGIIGLIASATGGIDENNIFLKALLFYLDYFMTTHIAAAIADTILDASFISCYGDREFALSNSKIAELAKKFDVTDNVIVEEFNRLRQQFRKGVFAVGASKDEMEMLLRAFTSKPVEEAKRRFEDHVNSLAHLNLLPNGDEQRDLLIQYTQSLNDHARRLKIVTLADAALERAADRLNMPNPISGNEQYIPPSKGFPTVGTSTQTKGQVMQLV